MEEIENWTNEELESCIKLCAEQCDQDPALKERFQKEPEKVFEELTGKKLPEELKLLSEEDLVSINGGQHIPASFVDPKSPYYEDLYGRR